MSSRKSSGIRRKRHGCNRLNECVHRRVAWVQTSRECSNIERAIIDAKYPVLRRAGGASAHPSRSPVPGPNVPSVESVSDGRAPSMRLLGPTEGKPFPVGVIARKYSRMLMISACSTSLVYLCRTRNKRKVRIEDVKAKFFKSGSRSEAANVGGPLHWKYEKPSTIQLKGVSTMRVRSFSLNPRRRVFQVQTRVSNPSFSA